MTKNSEYIWKFVNDDISLIKIHDGLIVNLTRDAFVAFAETCEELLGNYSVEIFFLEDSYKVIFRSLNKEGDAYE